MVDITILTPTYNRDNTIRRCYESLLNQEDKNFKWLIVDDGSTDATKSIVTSFIKEKKINIKYIYKKNAGKHTAINYGIKYINSDITLILDSDDYLTNDAIKKVVFYHNKYKKNENICGYSFLKIFTDGKIIGQSYPKNEEISNFIERRVNGKITGDKCEVFYTDCLKEYPFPEFFGEKFIGESTVWIPMALKYDMVHINEGIYVAEYLSDGLTKQGRKMRILCPNGGIEYAKVSMIKTINLKGRIKAAILFNCYSFFANKQIDFNINNKEYKLLIICTIPLGYVLFKYWKYSYLR